MKARQHRSTCHLFAALLIGAALAGCGSGKDDLDTYIEEVKSRKSDDIDPIPQIKPYESFAYLGEGRRDPFAPTPIRDGEGGGGTGVVVDLKRNKEPLEEFPLDALRMVGTINMKGSQYALIKAPDSVVHRVSVGNYLGQNFGKIVGITEGEVTLKEVVPDGFGGFQERPASILLSEK